MRKNRNFILKKMRETKTLYVKFGIIIKLSVFSYLHVTGYHVSQTQFAPHSQILCSGSCSLQKSIL